MQYTDYARAERQRLSSQELDSRLEYWAGKLAGVRPLSLPRMAQPPARSGRRAASLDTEIAPELVQTLRSIAASARTTLSNTLLAAFAIVIARYCGQADFVVGTPVTTRIGQGTEGLLGCFVNMLLLRILVCGEDTFGEILARTSRTAFDAFAHLEVPFEKVIGAVEPSREAGRDPLLQVVWAFQSVPRQQATIEGLTVRQTRRVERARTAYDLECLVWDRGDRIGARLLYNADLMDRDLVAEIERSWLQVLRQTCGADPARRVRDLEWPSTPPAAVAPKHADPDALPATLVDLFREQYRERPDAIAVVDGHCHVSFERLQQGARTLVRRLRSLGVGPEARVGVYIDRGAELVVSLFGVLLAGGAYVPLDPEYPRDRVLQVLEDARPAAVVTSRRRAIELAGASVPVVVQDEDDTVAGEGPDHDVTLSPASCAYVIYTSGSTGRPKGVVVSHRHVVRLLTSTRRWFDFGSGDCWTLFHSYAFDFSVWEIFGCLLHGGRLVVVPFWISRSPEDLLQLMADEAVSVLNATPSVFRALVRADAERPRSERLTALGTVIFGGEALDPRLLQPWFDRYGDRHPRLVNMYGITETTVHVTYQPLTARDAHSASSRIGVAIPDLRVYVVDGWGGLAPADVWGELYVGGAGVARGYAGQPALTAERFVPDPFGGERGARLYRTGDRGRWCRDGALEYQGRVDHQVKIRGYRIEPGEVEAVLGSARRVAHMAVVPREGPHGLSLVAYVVGADGVETVVQQAAMERLPAYMRPAAIVVLPQLPLTANGKLDRQSLPAPAWTSAQALRTPIEELVAGMWSHVLGVPVATPDADFFALGGHSLLATQVISRVRRVLGVELPLRSLFDSPTVGGLAAQIAAAQRAGAPPRPPVTRSPDERGPAPLSWAQQRLWFLDQLMPGQAVFNCPAAVRLGGALDRRALASSVSAVVRRHEVLRSVFTIEGDLVVQRVQRPAPVPVPVVDLTALGGRAPRAARRLARREAERAFDLQRGPLLRVQLLRLAPAEHVLAATLHHVVCDGWSVGLFVKELTAHYIAARAGTEANLPPLPVQYGDYARWQRRWQSEAAVSDGLAYWRRQLAGVRPLVLPTDAPRPAVPSYRGRRAPAGVSGAVRHRLEALGHSEGVTTFMLLLAAFQVLLARYTGQRDIVVGTDVTMRGGEELEGLIGFFVNQLALRTDVGGRPTVHDLLARVRTTALDAYAHQDVPFEQVVDAAGVERDLRRAPLFDVVFAYHAVRPGGLMLPGIDVREGDGSGARIAKVDLTLELWPQADGWGGSLEYATDLFSRRRVVRLLGHWTTLLQGLSEAHGESAVDSLPWLTVAERTQLLTTWNSTGAGIDDVDLNARIGRAARIRAAATAITAPDGTLTYAALMDSAAGLAGVLRAHGIGREDRVGIALPRGSRHAAAVLAVAHAGAVYVPLAAEHPWARRVELARSANVGVVITEDGESAGWTGEGFAVLAPQARGTVPEGRPAWSPEQSAYLIYTSGSTGTPKGVLVTARGLSNHLSAKIDTLGLGPTDVVAQSASLAFDIAVWQLLAPLAVGATVAVLDDDTVRDPVALLAALRDNGVTVWEATPGLLAVLPESLQPGLGRLRWLIATGEALPVGVCRRWLAGSDVPVVNAYGPTECADDVTQAVITDATRLRSTVPIGAPLRNTQAYVVDDGGGPVPIGVPGHLLIGGAGVARGYWGDPARTAAAFLPDGWSGAAGARVYATGDRAQWREDGTLDFLGRRDHQIKVRGHRVELGEIEAVLHAHPAVKHAVAQPWPHADGTLRLVAYVVPRRWTVTGDRGGYRLPTGSWVAEQNHNETRYLYGRIFERHTYFRHGIEVPADATILDVGANIGLFALYAAERAPRGIVFAFEPIPAIFESLAANVSVCGDRIRPRAFALGHAAAPLALRYYPGYSIMSGVTEYADAAADAEIVRTSLMNERRSGSAEASTALAQADEILRGRFEGIDCLAEMRRLSNVIREERLGHIDLIKIDVQRAGLSVLEGIDEDHWPLIDQIVMEVHDRVAGDPRSHVELIVAKLSERGFTVVAEQEPLLQATGLFNLYARRGHVSWRSAAAADAPPFEEAELRAYVDERLPEWMRPARYVTVMALPMTTAGKIDRRALPEPEWTAAVEEDAAPRTAVESLLAGIWQEVLGVPAIARRADFFQLGGHSLLATQTMARVRRAFGVEVPVRALFEGPTLTALASRIETALRGGEAVADVPILPVPPDAGPAPLSFAQQRLWFVDQLEPGNVAYNCPAALRLRGRLDIAALRDSLSGVVRRHEVLRSVFVPVGDTVAQQVQSAGAVAIAIVDLARMPERRRVRAARRLARLEAERPFDLRRCPLLRVQLLRLQAGDHVLLVTLHHVVSDLWSVALLIEEVTALYASRRLDRPALLPSLTIQYGDYARWQREWLHGSAMSAGLAYWKTQLADAPTLELPTDSPRPAVRTHRAGAIRVHLPVALSAQLATLSQREGVTLFMILLAAWQTVLARVSGQHDIVVGTDVANRPRTELEPLIGFFINQVVLRTDLSGQPTFAAVLGRVRAVALAAYAHESVPFEQVVDAVAPPRDLGRAPLFQVKLVLQNVRRRAVDLAGLRAEPFASAAPPRIKLDLHLQLTETAAGIVGELTYATDLFARARIAQLARLLETVLTAVAADPQTSIAAVPWLTPAEQAAVVTAATGPAVAQPTDVWTLIAQQIAARPDAIAVDDGIAQVSYGTLGARVAEVAACLRGWGVGTDVCVGVYAPPSTAAIEAMLGILAAGGAYVVVDPGTPPARAARLLEAAQSALVLTTAAGVDELPALSMPVFMLEREAPITALPPAANPTLHPQQLACVIFTSGSTGEPKGVAVAHASLATYVAGIMERVPWTPATRVAVVTTLAADLSYTTLYGCLCTGGRLYLIDRATGRDGGALAARLTAMQIDVVKLPPSQAWLLEHAGGGWPRQHVILGGETLPGDLVAAVRAQGARCAIWNHYGPTECAVGVSMQAVAASDTIGARIPIGTPLAGRALYVVDGTGALVPDGVAGELWIGGAGLARGYLTRPALTAARFRPDPWSATPGARVYRTGDRVQRGAGGAVTFIGRRDDQIKIRGYRVDPREVETVLAAHPRVGRVAVISGATPLGDACLLAYVVARSDDGGLEPVLRAHAAAQLPDYLRPSAYVLLPLLPVTTNGKLQRDALPAPVWASPATAVPRTPLEELIADVWTEVLARPVRDVDADFFQLGGHSLLATQVVARLRQVCDVELALRVLFEAPTIAGLAAAVARARPAAVPPPMPAASLDEPAPLSFAQQRLWLVDQLEPGNPAYNCAAAVRLRGPLHARGVRESLTTIVARHAVLRSVLTPQDDAVVQSVRPPEAVPLPTIDLTPLGARAGARCARRLARTEASGPFDLRRGRLLRTRLLRLGPEDHVLLVTLHHIVSDGWSIGLLVREFTALYSATPPGAAEALPPLPLQYADYARWQRTWLQGATLAAHLEYWRSQLAGAELLHLPTDRPRPRRRTGRGGRVPLRIPAPLTSALRALGRREGATLFMTLFAAFATLLHRLTGQRDVVIGTPTASRLTPEIEPLIGFFINLLNIRTRFTSELSFLDLLAGVRETVLQAYEHQEVSHDILVQELAADREAVRDGVMRACLAMNQPVRAGGADNHPPLRLESFSTGVVRTKRDLTVFVAAADDALIGCLEYACDIFDRDTIARFADLYLKTLEAVVARPAAPVLDLPLDEHTPPDRPFALGPSAFDELDFGLTV
jgi:amino acid adenylation domain-containing protein/FkbM family methyltransferase